jgi:nicotinate phosphoribosyltransferase
MSDVAPALLVDVYELTMADAYRQEGIAGQPATFSLFVRTLPPTRGYLVAAGLDDCLTWLESLEFGPDELGAIDRLGIFTPAFLEWLGELRFRGRVRAVPEGTIVFGGEPILEVDAPLAVAQLAETFLLNQISTQTTLATKAARCRFAGAGRAVVDFALRRSQGIDAGMKLARVARLVGLSATSNVAGADRYGLAASGTMGHSFVQAYEHEIDAFRAFARAFGPSTVLLVDTYDTRQGIEHAIDVADECRREGRSVHGIRLDSGDLAGLARHARRRLDEAGFPDVQILASGGLDEHEIARLLDVEHAPIDGFGVGSSLGVAADAPSLDSVYKLVESAGRPVRKTSTGKETWPAPKQVWRAFDWSRDTIGLHDESPPSPDDRALLVEVMRQGRRTAAGGRTLEEMNVHFEEEWRALPEAVKHLTQPTEFRIDISARLRALTAELDTLHASEPTT